MRRYCCLANDSSVLLRQQCHDHKVDTQRPQKPADILLVCTSYTKRLFRRRSRFPESKDGTEGCEVGRSTQEDSIHPLHWESRIPRNIAMPLPQRMFPGDKGCTARLRREYCSRMFLRGILHGIKMKGWVANCPTQTRIRALS